MAIAYPERVHKEVRGAELVKLPNVAHPLNMEVPVQFNDLVYRFLRR
jgi:pimeloyl-ACP methyl ester carboxylesterase